MTYCPPELIWLLREAVALLPPDEADALYERFMEHDPGDDEIVVEADALELFSLFGEHGA